jgi:hypothetical protein
MALRLLSHPELCTGSKRVEEKLLRAKKKEKKRRS